MNRTFFFIIVGILLVGCQDQLAIRETLQPDDLATKAGEFSVQIDEPYVFLAQKDFKAFTDIIGLENRFAACEVPETTLKAMTTDALVRSVLNYPMNFIYSAYDNPFDVVDLIMKNSALHRELIGRSDAAEVLLLHFAQADIDQDNRDSVFNRDDARLTYSNEMFFEYLLASHRIPGLAIKENKETLQSIAKQKLASRLENPKAFSELSLAPLRSLADEPVGGTRTSSTWTWYTPLGHSLTVEARDEMTDYESMMITLAYTDDYPTVPVHGMASNRYNGHGYAWLINDLPYGTSNPATIYNSWLERYIYGVFQLGRFWDNDFYDTGSSSDYEKLYYSSADHSAILYDSNASTVISKWGNGPLMEHTIANCPYSTYNLQYFTIRTSPAYYAQGSISGLTQVMPYTPHAYSFPAYRGITSWTWSAQNLTSGTSSYTLNPSSTAPSCTFSCHESGTYKLIFEGKYNNNTIVHKELTITCL